MLNEYIEIAENDIVDTQPMGADETTVGTLVWVRHDAIVEFTVSGPLKAQGEYLQGGITGEYLPGMGIDAFAQANPALIGTIIRTVSPLACSRKTLCTGWCCPDTGPTGCAPGSGVIVKFTAIRDISRELCVQGSESAELLRPEERYRRDLGAG
jgi:hypothetical protein